MKLPSPIVRSLIACEDVLVDPASPGTVSLLNLISVIASRSEPPFPFRQPEFCVFMQLAECRGHVSLRIRIVHAESGQFVFESRPRLLKFGSKPLEVYGLAFRIRHCPFPQPGIYFVELLFDDEPAAQYSILVR